MADSHEAVEIDESDNHGQYSREEVEAAMERVEITSESWTGVQASLDTDDPEPAPEGPVEPFSSEEEMHKALDARTENGQRRIDVDPEYEAEVQAKIEAGMTVTPFGFTVHDPEAAKVARARKLAAKRALQAKKDAVTNDNLKISPRPGGEGQGQPRPFSTEAELVNAMNDERYETDSAYTRKVDARLTATDWF